MGINRKVLSSKRDEIKYFMCEVAHTQNSNEICLKLLMTKFHHAWYAYLL